jgi:hypothetical protein
MEGYLDRMIVLQRLIRASHLRTADPIMNALSSNKDDFARVRTSWAQYACACGFVCPMLPRICCALRRTSQRSLGAWTSVAAYLSVVMAQCTFWIPASV